MFAPSQTALTAVRLRGALDVRRWEEENLPLGRSALGIDVFVLIGYKTLINEPLSLKSLFYSSRFSEAGVRKHIRALLADGWCVLERSEQDRRLRLIVAEPKMLAVLEQYTKELARVFGGDQGRGSIRA